MMQCRVRAADRTNDSGVDPMRKMLCNMLFLGLTALVVIVTSGASSQARPRGPVLGAAPPDLYCLQGRIWGYPGNCQFSNYAQCAATASGTDAYCGPNPQYLFAGQPRGYGYGPY
jgi:hypothetical protein